eukprot:6188612-Pleurochrysis_carterae.AAC.2
MRGVDRGHAVGAEEAQAGDACEEPYTQTRLDTRRRRLAPLKDADGGKEEKGEVKCGECVAEGRRRSP